MCAPFLVYPEEVGIGERAEESLRHSGPTATFAVKEFLE